MDWATKKTDYFISGCENLYLGFDHKPLIGLFNPDRDLGDIVNTKLRKYVERISHYKFKCFYVPGPKNQLSDAGSRYPVGKAGTAKVYALGADKHEECDDSAIGMGQNAVETLLLNCNVNYVRSKSNVSPMSHEMLKDCARRIWNIPLFWRPCKMEVRSQEDTYPSWTG